MAPVVKQRYAIKRYNNRRLYDAAQKRFLNLADLRELVRAGHELVVEDANGRDITRQVLLQVIAECEDAESPLLSAEVLHTIARAYGDVMQSVFSRYLDESVRTFLGQQADWRKTVEAALQKGPMAAMDRMAKSQVEFWTSAQAAMSEAMLGKPAKGARIKRKS